ncbi:uncharacterized protein FA14DRAFT_56131 [Meira miltonrushii]|uniref:Uncharacterized protein n=1 Tax=Meira miltonrushii TaxID=1280837 RepID=A0A316V7H4_9BASI|nr:uncharacterized protein FA14DRAFT_56131 [Meira miltonrushii]PWN33144.1 hypothetical protein FA14DRAFT_56131 [Meira miltonrushii]
MYVRTATASSTNSFSAVLPAFPFFPLCIISASETRKRRMFYTFIQPLRWRSAHQRKKGSTTAAQRSLQHSLKGSTTAAAQQHSLKRSFGHQLKHMHVRLA